MHFQGATSTQLVSSKILIEVDAGNFYENIPCSYLLQTEQTIAVEYIQIGTDIFKINWSGGRMPILVKVYDKSEISGMVIANDLNQYKEGSLPQRW